jgi:hypothetical protein
VPIDYLAASEKYRPDVIATLLVGEGPPPNGETFFYIPRFLPRSKPIEKDRSLPATIFHHYFRALPSSVEEYDRWLHELVAKKIFLIDLLSDAVKVRGSPEGVQRVKDAIPKFRNKLRDRRIVVPDERIIFLLARTEYLPELRREFPVAKFIRWIDFRMNPAKGWREASTQSSR